MFNQQVYILNTFRIFIDAFCIIFAGYSAKFIVKYYVPDVAWMMDDNFFVISILVVMVANNYVMGRLGMYGDRRYPGIVGIVWPTFQSVVASFVIWAGAVFVLHPPNYPRSFLLWFAVFSLAYMVVLKFLTQLYTRVILDKGFNIRNVLIVGNENRGGLVKDLLDSQVSWGHRIVGRINTSPGAADEDEYWQLENLPEIVKAEAIDEVIFAIGGDRAINLRHYLNFCRKVGLSVKILPALWDPDDHKWTVDSLQGVPFFSMRSTNFNANGILYKRIMDVAGGAFGVLIFMIMYPFLAVAIKLDSPGPVLFKQKRVGLNGRIFNLYKFRTMHQNAEEMKQALMDQNEMNGAMFKLKDDPRITRMGHFFRKTSLDEFPQFINVLKGEMSLVGTRPPTLDEVAQYEPWHLRRISGKPGITGLWQISGRNKITDFDEVVKLDCQYLDKWRFIDDIKILIKTIGVVLKRKGAI